MKQDIIIAKNYLNEDELDSLNRLVVIFLETAEFRAKNRHNLTMSFWQENVDKILLNNDQPLLVGKGSVSNALMEKRVSGIFEEFDTRRKQYEAMQADQEDMRMLEELEKELKRNKK